jgi:cobalt-zinc-cadmium efflux system membrane fusion protein
MKAAWICILTVALVACGERSPEAEGPEHEGHGAPVAAEFERGPHRGRMLRTDDFAIEVTIFETGVPPQFRLYAYSKDQPLPAKDVEVNIGLTRVDGAIDRFTFAPEGDHLVGSGTVVEPHSFDVMVDGKHAGKSYHWSFASYEGRTVLPAAIAESAGVETDVAGPATIHDRIQLMGRVTLDSDRFAEVRSRFPGPVREVRVKLGDVVKAGQTLAIVENRESLRSFAVTAPFAGTVIARHTNAGNVAGDGPLFEVADLTSLWIELNAFGKDAARISEGQTLRVTASAGDLTADVSLHRLLPLASAASQTLVARAELPNPEGRWRPGMSVNAEVTVAEREVPLAVRRIGLQRFRDFTVVFGQFGETFEVRMLELGEQDDEHVEVLAGLKPGTRYVTEQSFLIKADIEKSGASHDH